MGKQTEFTMDDINKGLAASTPIKPEHGGKPPMPVEAELVEPEKPEKQDPDFAAALEKPLGFSGGKLQINDSDDLKRAARLIWASPTMKIGGAKSATDVALALMYGINAGLSSIECVKSMMIVNGRPAIFGDALLSLIYQSRELVDIEETYDDKAETARCVVVRVQRLIDDSFARRTTTRTFGRADAEQAGLWGKRGRNGEPTPWVTYPRRMLAMRARAFALRDAFADKLSGMSVYEDIQDIPHPDAFDPEKMRGSGAALIEAIGGDE